MKKKVLCLCLKAHIIIVWNCERFLARGRNDQVCILEGALTAVWGWDQSWERLRTEANKVSSVIISTGGADLNSLQEEKKEGDRFKRY